MLMLMGTTFLVLAMTTAPTVLAAPRFIGTPQIVKNPDLSLTGNRRVVGLGSLPTQIFLTTSGATAVLQCVNPDPGGDNPPPVSFGPSQGFTTTVQPHNGQVTGSATVGPPTLPTASQICPAPNYGMQVVSLTYSDVAFHIVQDQGSGLEEVLSHNFGNVDPP